MSDRQETAIGQARTIAVNSMPLLIPIGLAVGLAAIADNYVDPILIWGGTKCESSMGIDACVGYVPIGLAALLVVSAALTMPLIGWTATKINDSERLP